MHEPHLTCLYVHEMLRDTGDIVPRSTSNLRYEQKLAPSRRKKLTEHVRGLTPVVMTRSTIDNNLHKKDVQFEYQYSTKKVSTYQSNVCSQSGSPVTDIQRSYEAELVKYRQQRTQSNRNRQSANNRHSKNFGLQIKRMQYESPMHSIQIQAAKFRRLMQRKPQERYTKRLNSDKKTEGQRKKHLVKSSVQIPGQGQERDTTADIAQKKLNNYKEFLTFVQFHYESSRQVELKRPAKGAPKLAVFIGRGNNRNLLVTLFKKRWWWKVVDTMKQANFVWTQLKVNELFEKQPQGGNILRQQIQPKFQRRKLQQTERRFVDPRLGTISREELQPIELETVHNHFEQNYMLGNKKGLFHNLSRYCEYHKRNVFDIVPLTYHIERVNGRAFKQFCKKVKEMPNGYWIVKPGENTNRGTGINVTNKLTKIRKLVEDDKHTYIIQQYLCNPLLYNRRKFDIRTYVLLNRINDVIKAYWYQEGYLRTSSEVFSLDDLEDPFIHLTNDAIQKHGQDYGRFESGNKVSYSQFQRYMDANLPKDKYQVSDLVASMKQIAAQCIRATYFKVDPHCRHHNLEIFGLDFIVDRSFKPWLLEINTNPCLELSSQLLGRLIPSMVENALRISLDPVFPPNQQCPWVSKFYLSDNFLERNRFQLIFDSRCDSDLNFEHYCAQDKQNYEDDVEQYQNEGEELALDGNL